MLDYMKSFVMLIMVIFNPLCRTDNSIKNRWYSVVRRKVELRAYKDEPISLGPDQSGLGEVCYPETTKIS